MTPTPTRDTPNGPGVLGTREYPLAIRVEHMLVMAVLLTGVVAAIHIEQRRGGGFDFSPWWMIGFASLLVVGLGTGILQRVWNLRIVLTPTDLIAPAPMTRTMTAIPRASIITCRIVTLGNGRALIVKHRHGQLFVPGFRLPSSAALDEIYENLLNAPTEQLITAKPDRSATANTNSVGSTLDIAYHDYINWPVAIGGSILTAIAGFGAAEPSSHLPVAFRWSVAAACGLGVLLWVVISTSRWKGRIVVTQATLSAPTFPGSKNQVSIPLSAITGVDIADRGNRNQKLIVRHSGARIEIRGRCLATTEAFDQLYAALSERRDAGL